MPRLEQNSFLELICYAKVNITGSKEHLRFLSLLLVLDLESLRLDHEGHEEERRAGERNEGDGAGLFVAPLGPGHGALNFGNWLC